MQSRPGIKNRLPAAVVGPLRRGRDIAQAVSRVAERQALRRRWHRARATGRPLVFDATLDRRGIGMFAELNWVLYLLAYARSWNARPVISLGSATYLDPAAGHTDWLEHLFVMPWRRPAGPDEARVAARVTHLGQLPDFDGRVGRLSLWEAHALAAEFLVPSPAVQAAAAAFARDELGDHYLSLHWRGTDKVLEAPAVSVDAVAAKVLQVTRALPRRPTSVFVASDDGTLVAAVRARLKTVVPDMRVVSRHEHRLPVDGRPLHLRGGRSGAERRALGEDALVDCLLLAGGAALIRTASFLSGWCSVFQPLLPVYLLNAPYANALWFPDREVVHLAAFHERRLSDAAEERL